VAAVGARSLEGTYRADLGPDVATQLVLHHDGKFEYFLSAGALDEHASGTWLVEGRFLRLQTHPKPKAPLFSSGPISSTAESKLRFQVIGPSGRGISGVHFSLNFDVGEPLEDYTQESGWSLPDGERRHPKSVEFFVPIHQLKSSRFAIDPARGNLLTFILIPNDLGVVDFDGVRIEINEGSLVMHRHGDSIMYGRARRE
jgi:hypothetical protein